MSTSRTGTGKWKSTRTRLVGQAKIEGRPCYWCKRTLDYDGDGDPGLRPELDHVLAVSRGGTDRPDNLVVACRNCNRGRGARMTAPPRPVNEGPEHGYCSTCDAWTDRHRHGVRPALLTSQDWKT